MSPPDLLVCGSLTVDNVITADGTLLPRATAGNAVYAALGAAIWGPSVGLVSRAGADFPMDSLAMLQDHGIDLGGIVRLDQPHGMNVAFAYQADGGRTREFSALLVGRIPPEERPRFVDYTTRGSTHRYRTWLGFAPDASDLPLPWAENARGAHLAAMPVQRQLSLAAHLHRTKPDRQVQLDSPWYDERELVRDFHSVLSRDLDRLLPSEADLAVWRPGCDPVESAAALARATGKPIIIKRGPAGALLVAANGRPALRIPPYPTAVADPTGAGDAFCGGVLAGILIHGELRLALACGTASASFAIQGTGLQGLIGARRAEAERRAGWVAERISSFEATEVRS